MCGINFDKARRRSVCRDCYPVYRKAVTLFYAARQRSILKNLPFDLTIEWVIEGLKQKYCSATNLPFRIERGGSNYSDRHPLTPSIDQIIPGEGYLKSNCRVVIWWYNSAKQRFTDLELWHLCAAVVNYLDVNSVLSAQKKVGISTKTT